MAKKKPEPWLAYPELAAITDLKDYPSRPYEYRDKLYKKYRISPADFTPFQISYSPSGGVKRGPITHPVELQRGEGRSPYYFKNEALRDEYVEAEARRPLMDKEYEAYRALGTALRRKIREAKDPTKWDVVSDEDRQHYKKHLPGSGESLGLKGWPYSYYGRKAFDKASPEEQARMMENIQKVRKLLEHPKTTSGDIWRTLAEGVPSGHLPGFGARGAPHPALRGWWRNARTRGKITPEGNVLIDNTAPQAAFGDTLPPLSFTEQTPSTALKDLYDAEVIRHVPRTRYWVVPGWLASRLDPEWKQHHTAYKEFLQAYNEAQDRVEPDAPGENNSERLYRDAIILGTVLSLKGLKNITRALRESEHPQRLLEELGHFVSDHADSYISRFGSAPRDELVESRRQIQEANEEARLIRAREEARRVEAARLEALSDEQRLREDLTEALGHEPTDEEFAAYQAQLADAAAKRAADLDKFTYSQDVLDVLEDQEGEDPWRKFDDAAAMNARGQELGHCYGKSPGLVNMHESYRDRVREHQSLLLTKGEQTAQINLETNKAGIITGARIQQVKGKRKSTGSQPDIKPDDALLKIVKNLIGKNVESIARDNPQLEGELSDRVWKVLHEQDPYGSLNEVLQERGRYA